MLEFLKISLLFTAFGCFFEVGFTATFDSIEQLVKNGKAKVDVRFFGHWSLLYAFIYGILLPAFWIVIAIPYVYDLHWTLRALIYGFTFQVGEYCTMYLFHLVFGESPSESSYKGKFDSIHNFTRLSYFPIFVLEAFSFELIYSLFM